ncbi:MAG: hypothetical protein WCO61_04800 [Alphaproteobacteria bacterium]
MRLSHSVDMTIPAHAVDLYKWLTEMTPAEYETYSQAHRAMGSWFENGFFHMVNVEMIGNEMIKQHYILIEHRPDRIALYSKATKAYVLRWFPAIVGVPWIVEVNPIDDKKSRLTCTIGADFPNIAVRLGAWFNGLGGFFLYRHLIEESTQFARDIESKFSTLEK